MPSPEETKILVVDDNEASRYSVVRTLQRAGYSTVEAATGDDALRQIGLHPALIIMDVQLPDANGLDISRMVRANPNTCLIPILQISATFTETADRIKGLDAGADGYLVGPVAPEELLANVRMLLRLRQAQRELARAKDQLSLQNEILETRVRERTAKLENTINDLETFSYSITHDMRAPLRAMQGFSKLLLEGYGDKFDAEGKDFLMRIANAANRLDLLIRDVLSYSSIVRTDLVLVPVDVDKLLRDIIREYPDFQPPNAQIRLVSPLPAVLANEAFLTQCFSNLLGNAIKFVNPGTVPEVEVSARPVDEFVRFEIKDNGIGIPAKHQQGIFKLFHRAQHDYSGTGIGLAIVQKAAERMGGQVGVQSEPGQGSTFWIDLRPV